MRAKHKYNPKTREGARRIAQSMGYKISIYDMPDMINLLARAGIYLDGIDYESSTNIVEDTPLTDKEQLADTETVTF